MTSTAAVTSRGASVTGVARLGDVRVVALEPLEGKGYSPHASQGQQDGKWRRLHNGDYVSSSEFLMALKFSSVGDSAACRDIQTGDLGQAASRHLIILGLFS